MGQTHFVRPLDFIGSQPTMGKRLVDENMARECQRSTVTAVHSFEDCSLQQFKIAKRLGKACIYDMPIGYYPAWEEIQQRLAAEFGAWLPDGGLPETPYVRPEQKKSEMELADLVIGRVPSWLKR
jgi:hypothetical protein